MTPESAQLHVSDMSVCNPSTVQLAGDIPSTSKVRMLKFHDPANLSCSYTKSPIKSNCSKKPSAESKRYITEVTFKSIRISSPSSSFVRSKSRPKVLHRSRGVQQEPEACPFVSLVKDFSVVGEELVAAESKHNQIDTKIATNKHGKMVNVSTYENLYEKFTEPHHLRRFKQDISRKGITGMKKLWKNKYTQAPHEYHHRRLSQDSERSWTANSESQTLRNSTETCQYHECTVIDNKDANTLISDESLSSEIFLKSLKTQCHQVSQDADVLKNLNEKHQSKKREKEKEEVSTASCTVDLANADEYSLDEELQTAGLDTNSSRNETQVCLSEAFMKALIQVHQKPTASGLFGRVEHMRFH